MKNRGVILVLLLLAAGLAAAVGAIWHQYRQTRQSLRFWGKDIVRLIDRAPQVELFADWPVEAAVAGELPPPSSAAVDISDARGLTHFRRSLLEDGSFEDLNTDRPAASVDDWDYAARFTDGEASVLVVFDVEQRLLSVQSRGSGAVGSGAVGSSAVGSGAARVTERMAQGLARFFDEQAAQADQRRP